MFLKKVLLIFLFPILLLSSCSNEYWQFHEKKQAREQEKQKTIQSLRDFSVEQIEDHDEEILATPDKKVLDRIVSMMNQSKNQIFIEVYIFTGKRILESLKDAKKRWVDVRVVLEKNVFGAPNINSKTFKSLQWAGISITYDNSKLYNFVHTKLLIIDDTYIITTGNLSYSSFTTNREFFVIGKNPTDLQALKNIFLADFAWQEISESTANIVVSPVNSRKKIETLLKSAKKDIFLYAENFWDDSILNILSQKVTNGIPVTICMADPSKVKSNAEAILLLRSKRIDVRTSKKPVIHAKSALVDSEHGYIGSENYSTNSLDENREIGTLIQASPEFIKMFRSVFESDCPDVKGQYMSPDT